MTASTQRYLVFAGEFEREPMGGMRDLAKRCAIRGEAIAWAQGYVEGKGTGAWAHIYDQTDGKEIWASDK